MRLDLHTHTNHSFDCTLTVENLIKSAGMNNLDVIAVTDLDTMSACSIAAEISENVMVIPGMEIATSRGTHLIGLFLTDEIVSRDIFDVIEEIHEQSGLVMVPHPFRERVGLLHNRFTDKLYDGEEMMRIMSGVDLIEAFAFGSSPEEAVETDRYLQTAPDISQVTGSDARSEADIGKAYIELENIRSNRLDDIKEALLESPRTLRYEVFTSEDEKEIKTLVIEGRKRSLLWKIRQPLTQPVWRSLKSIYNRSAGLLRGSRSKNRSRNTT